MNDKIILKNKVIERVNHIEDCKRIKKVLFDAGYDLTLEEVEELWHNVSDEVCACWLCADDDENIKFWLGLKEDVEGEE